MEILHHLRHLFTIRKAVFVWTSGTRKGEVYIAFRGALNVDKLRPRAVKAVLGHLSEDEAMDTLDFKGIA